MNKNILVLSVLLALNSTAFANAGDQANAAVSVEKTDKPAEKLAGKPTTDAPLKAKPETKEKGLSIAKVEGRDIVKNENGTLAAYICETGVCHKKDLVTQDIDNTVAIGKEIQEFIEKSKKAEEAKKPEVAKKEEKFDKNKFTNELIADLEKSILDDCDVETKSSRKRDRDDDLEDDTDSDTDRPSWARIKRRVKGESSRSSVATSGRFKHAQSDASGLSSESSQSSECTANELQEKLEELTQGFDEDLTELGLKKSDLANLDEISENLNREIKKEKDPKEKSVLELALSKVKTLSEKVKITQTITKKFVKSQVLPRLENSLVFRAGNGETSLHEIAAGTPELFKEIRNDASLSILEVYNKQIKSQIALLKSGNTNASTEIGLLALQNRAYMTQPQSNNKSAGQNFMEQFALDNSISRSHIRDLFNYNELNKYYEAASAPLLGGTQNNALPLPGVLSTKSMTGTDAGLQPSQHQISRVNRNQQIMNPQQGGRASVPAASGPPRGGTGRGF